MDTVLVNDINSLFEQLSKIDTFKTNFLYLINNHSIIIEKNYSQSHNVHWINIIFNDIEISTDNFRDIESYLLNCNSQNQLTQDWSNSYPAIIINQLNDFTNITNIKIQSNRDNKLQLNFLFEDKNILIVKSLFQLLQEKYLIHHKYKTTLNQHVLNIVTSHGIEVYENTHFLYGHNTWTLNLHGDIYIKYVYDIERVYHILEFSGFYFETINNLEDFINYLYKDNQTIITNIQHDQSIFQFIEIKNILSNFTFQLHFINPRCIKLVSYQKDDLLDQSIDDLLNSLIDTYRIALANPLINTFEHAQILNICIINDFGFPVNYLKDIITPLLTKLGYIDNSIIFVEYNQLNSIDIKNSHVIYNISETDEINKLKNQLPNTVFISCGLEHDLLSISKQRITKEFIQRVKHEDRALTQDDYTNLSKNLNFDNDYKELKDNLNKCSHEADFFITYHSDKDIRLSKYKLHQQLKRIIYLLHSYNYYSPTQDEFMMYMAFASALRSTDLSRQVGAVITTQYGDIIATGANDIPKSGGGLYFANIDTNTNQVYDTAIGKDYMRGFDSNVIERIKIIDEITTELGLDTAQITRLKKSKLKNLTEYGRVVHAEMEALMACARNNTSTRDATLYCTTFPCHNCAKHIIASGIKRVVYIEPYSKSKAIPFHIDAIINNMETEQDNKVYFDSFQGVGPRLYRQIFHANNSRKNSDTGKIITTWTPKLIKI